jgi:hypothetical protein
VVVLSTGELKLYVNGTLYTSVPNNDGTGGGNLRIFGCNYTPQGSLAMKMYNFLAYDKVLSDEEIYQNYSIDTVRYPFPIS